MVHYFSKDWQFSWNFTTLYDTQSQRSISLLPSCVRAYIIGRHIGKSVTLTYGCAVEQLSIVSVATYQRHLLGTCELSVMER